MSAQWRLELDFEAKEELSEAARWYDNQRAGLGIEFLESVKEAMERIQQNPLASSLAPSVSESLGVRHQLLRRFPYAVSFLVLEDVVRVIAVAHCHRRPGYWRRRVRRTPPT